MADELREALLTKIAAITYFHQIDTEAWSSIVADLRADLLDTTEQAIGNNYLGGLTSPACVNKLTFLTAQIELLDQFISRIDYVSRHPPDK